jgi:hypothetical protein
MNFNFFHLGKKRIHKQKYNQFASKSMCDNDSSSDEISFDETRCSYCGAEFGTMNVEVGFIADMCNKAYVYNKALSNSETCESCKMCCPGHCFHCGDVLTEEKGGRIIGGYGDFQECSWIRCKHIFHFNSAWCKEGIRCRDKSKKTRQFYCTDHMKSHLKACNICMTE